MFEPQPELKRLNLKKLPDSKANPYCTLKMAQGSHVIAIKVLLSDILSIWSLISASSVFVLPTMAFFNPMTSPVIPDGLSNSELILL